MYIHMTFSRELEEYMLKFVVIVIEYSQGV